MAYIVEADLAARLSVAVLIQLTDDEKTGTVNSAIVVAILAAAEATVNGYVGTRYLVPVSPVPGLLKELALDVAVYLLYLRRQRVTEDARRTYDDALKKLEHIAKGLITLGVEPPPSSAPQSSSGEVLPSESAFSRAALKEF